MATAIVLEATKRETVGKKVRHLRREGLVPGVLYGPGFESIEVQMPWTELRLALRDAGGSSIIELKVDGESYNALVRHVHRAPVRGDVLHVDFYRVRMDVVIRTEVPVVLVGEADKLDDQGGMVMQEMNSIEVECLPTVLPQHIEVDISGLAEIGAMITVADLPVLEGVTYLADPEALVLGTTYASALQSEEEGEFEGSSEPELIRRERDEFEDE